MKIVSVALRSLNGGLTRRFHPPLLRSLSTSTTLGYGTGDQQTDNSFESTGEFEQRIFGQNSGSNSKNDAFFSKLERLGKARANSRSTTNGLDNYLNDLDDEFNTLSDGMDGKLEKAARYFEYDSEDVDKDDYSYRYDTRFLPDMTYGKKDLDLTKPGVQRVVKREFTVTTDEALKKADFRNVRFLASFLTDAGIMIKRSQTGISAKAQRKIAREIKTARAFGLMPFTTMGNKAFRFGKTMEGLDEDFAYESYNDNRGADMEGDFRA
ncbi:hypothetical protein L6164_028653 [Bauhinia variegata]|uniref:Uncharacterized protein n=1 Tax=Bauhinia variegata TaxID=167791 RepID=A0ACB9L6V6_BAUVA|nr:hypothetical protein L6164_028653 [Bauhinia variegata]